MLNIAILDLYNGQPNQGMRCIRAIIREWSQQNGFHIQVDEFDVRQKSAVPGLNYDIYISTGGPGDPRESEGELWEKKYFNWLQDVEEWNLQGRAPSKFVFFICHSFQLICRHHQLGLVSQRKSTAFGVFPVHMVDGGFDEPVFRGLQDPFYIVDSRDFQVTQPDDENLDEKGARILCIEKDRPHVPYERAVMAIRFNDYMLGTQFHPEADAEGMSMYLMQEEKKRMVIENHGEEKWQSMVHQLNDPEKIMWTHDHILPNFLNEAVAQLQPAMQSR